LPGFIYVTTLQQPSAPHKAGPACSVTTRLCCHSVPVHTRFLFLRVF